MSKGRGILGERSMMRLCMLLMNLVFRKEVPRMIELYAVLIINRKRTFAQVPARYQDAVRQLLADAGLDENGDPIQP